MLLLYERSLELLQEAASVGGISATLLRDDERFDAVRSDPTFDEVLDALDGQ